MRSHLHCEESSPGGGRLGHRAGQQELCVDQKRLCSESGLMSHQKPVIQYYYRPLFFLNYKIVESFVKIGVPPAGVCQTAESSVRYFAQIEEIKLAMTDSVQSWPALGQRGGSGRLLGSTVKAG